VAGGGRPGPVITLPKGAVNLVEGTDAGLLLEIRRGHNFGLALWNPGAAPRALPYSPSWSDGFDATARLVAYGTDCGIHETSPYAPQANSGYDACNVLRVFDVLTGKLVCEGLLVAIPRARQAPAGVPGERRQDTLVKRALLPVHRNDRNATSPDLTSDFPRDWGQGMLA